MRIAVFTDCFLPQRNGVVTSVTNAARWLAARNHLLLIVTSSRVRRASHKEGRNISVFFCRKFNFLKLMKFRDFDPALPSHSVVRQVRSFRPDVVHAHFPSFLGWAAVICSRMLRVPLVGTYHTLFHDFLMHTRLPRRVSESSLARWVVCSYTKRFYNICDVVIAPSQAARRELLRFGVVKPVVVISNGVDTGVFRAGKWRATPGTILHVGRLGYEKRVDMVIRAFRLFARRNPSCRLVIVGEGPEENALKKLCGPLLGKRIFFLGGVEHSRIAEVYSGADLFMTASTIETEGLVILEAMASGLPVVGVDVMAIPEIVRDGVNGFVVGRNNVVGMADRIEMVLTDCKLRRKMSLNSVRLAERHSVDRSVKRLEMVYHLLAARRAGVQRNRIDFRKFSISN
ncbi:glycosyltransferase [Candidatus Woesearchaeota archaeon]|nr:glycosyltransferase [Candidatus Woesearchaeota archaeon]